MRVASVAPANPFEQFVMETIVRLKNLICCGLFLAFAMAFSGCGQSDPTANLPPEKKAPDPMQLGNDPAYAEQFGGGAKKKK
jgi:predicted small lipoprotein YifL